MNATDRTRVFLRQHRWRARGTLLVWSAVLTLAALAQIGLARLGWWESPVGWTLASIGAAALMLGAWFLRVHRLTPQRLARELDARWTLRARLESVVELADEESVWSAAQRENATQALAGRQPPGRLAWRGGQLALACLASLLLVEGAVLAVRSWRVSPAATTKAKPGSAPTDEFSATIEWKSPDSEIKATAIEEVPLVAVANSTGGFRSVSLELIIDGQREVSQPLGSAVLGEGTKPGSHEFTFSLLLDELQLTPFDEVSYQLVAELNTPGAKRMVTSPPQFVQIRPARIDALLTGMASEFPAMLMELKARQLYLIKQNAVLARFAAVASSDSSWASENARVSAAQDKLAGRTAEVLAWVNEQPSPPPLKLTNLGEAGTAMKSASRDMAARANEQATKPQNRALALLTELEQFITKALSVSQSMPAFNPFRDNQVFKLPARSETPAGELETLATREQKANDNLADSGDGAGGAENEQNAIAHDAARLAVADGYDPDVKRGIAAASAAAVEAARQLELGDRVAARVPAAAAQRALEQAVEAQGKAGRAAAVAEIEQVRHSLNAASRAGTAERAERLAAARTTFRAAAVQQQRTGSTEAAQEFVQLVEVIDAPASGSDRAGATASPGPNSPERAREVAVAAARAQVQLSARTAAVSRAVRLLNRAGDNPAAAAGNPAAGDAPGNVEIASQEAQWTASDAVTIRLAQQLAAQADATQRSGAANPAARRELGASAVQLATALEHGRPAGEGDQIVRRFTPADVDPEYRDAVEAYFERLSREGRRNPPNPAH